MSNINNRFNIEELLGKGGSGRVYKVFDQERDHTCALKTLQKSQISSKAVESFKQEFEILSSLSHPNVETVMEFGTVETGPENELGNLFFTSEYISGSPINEYLRDQEADWKQVVEAIVPVCRALHFLHSSDLIHFDVKPVNILKGERIILIDFGLAGENKLDDDIFIQGSIPYVAPEMIRRDNVDERVDLYSLGVTMYELLTGSLPFNGQNVRQLLQRHLEAPPPEPRKINEDMPVSLQNLVLDLLNKEPDRRVSDPQSVIERLRTITGQSFEKETPETSKGYIQSPEFVGRDQEFDILKHHWKEADKNDSSFALWITGEAGIGKTRLVNEFRRWAEMELVQILETHAEPQEHLPFQLIRSPVQKIYTYLQKFSEPTEEIQAFLESYKSRIEQFLDITEPSENEDDARSPNEQTIVQNLSDILFRGITSLEKETVFIAEDLHEADQASLKVLEEFVQKLQSRTPHPSKILLIGTFRPSESTNFLQETIESLKPTSQTINLHPLPRSDSRQLIKSMFGSRADDITERILTYEQSGNPWRIKQLLETSIDEEILVRGERGWNLDDQRFQKLTEQSSAASILQNRYRSLPDKAREFLEYLAVWPGNIPKSWLKKLIPLDPSPSTIHTLIKRGFLRKRQRDQVPVYSVDPTDLHAVIRDEISREQWKTLHAHLLDHFLEIWNQSQESSVEQANSSDETISYSFINPWEICSKLAWGARRYEEFLTYATEAAERALDRFSSKSAITLFEKIISVTSDSAILLDAWNQLASLYEEQGKHEIAYQYLSQALRKYDRTDAKWFQIRRKMANIQNILGNPEEAREHFTAGLEILQEHPEDLQTDLLIESIQTALKASKFEGKTLRNLDEAKDRTEELIDLIKTRIPEGARKTRLLAQAEENLGTFFRMLDRYEQAEDHFQESLSLYDEIKNQEDIASATNNLGLIYMSQGKLTKARKYFQESRALCEETGKQNFMPALILNLGIIDLKKGEPERALESFQEAYEAFQKFGNRRGAALALNNMGFAFEQIGEIQESLKHYKRQLDIARDLDNVRAKWRAISNVSRLALETGSLDKALDYCDDLQTLAEQHNLEKARIISASRKARIKAHQTEPDFAGAHTILDEVEEMLADIDVVDRIVPPKIKRSTFLRLEGKHEKALQHMKSLKNQYQDHEEASEDTKFHLHLEYTGLTIVRAAQTNNEPAMQEAQQHLQSTVRKFSSAKNYRLSLHLEFLQHFYEIVRNNTESAWQKCKNVLNTARENSLQITAKELKNVLSLLPDRYQKNRPFSIRVERQSSISTNEMTPAPPQPNTSDQLWNEIRSIQSKQSFPDLCTSFLETLRSFFDAEEVHLALLSESFSEETSGGESQKLSLVDSRTTSGKSSDVHSKFRSLEAVKNALENGKMETKSSNGFNQNQNSIAFTQLLFFRDQPIGGVSLVFPPDKQPNETTKQNLRFLTRELTPHLIRARNLQTLKTDPISALKTHASFKENLNQLTGSTSASSQYLFSIIEIDRYQKLQQRYGETFRNRLLQKMGKILRESNVKALLQNLDHSSSTVIAGRRIEDQFELYLELDSPSDCEEIINQLIDQWSQSSETLLSQEDSSPTISAGLVSGQKESPLKYYTLKERALSALTRSKRQANQNSFHFHEPEPSGQTDEHATKSDVSTLEPSSESNRNQLLNALSKIVNSDLDFEESLSVLLETTVEVTSARSGFVLSINNDHLKVLSRHVEPEENQPFSMDTTSIEEPVSKKIVRRAISEDRPLLIENASENETFQKFSTVRRLDLRSVLVVPVLAGTSPIGAIYLENSGVVNRFDQNDLDFVTSLAGEISGYLQNVREHKDRKEALEKIRKKYELAKETLQTRYKYENIVGKSKSMQNVFETMDKVIPSNLNVIIEGETGTGKELAAQAIHYNGPRKDNPFLAVNCARFSETLLESELFGHVKGAFTGADQDKPGLFEQADQGTLFLDEISEMSPEMQAKLLRVLETGNVRRIGAEKTKHLDVRIICATNVDLQRAMEKETFRSDLYYRLEDAVIKMPPLEDRKEDIPLLIEHFLEELSKEENDLPKKEMEQEAIQELMTRSWPGNVRQLRSFVRQIAIFTGEQKTIQKQNVLESLGEREKPDEMPEQITAETDLPESAEQPSSDITPENFPTLEEWEREAIQKALLCSEGNKKKAAELLGIARSTLYKKMNRFDLNEN